MTITTAIEHRYAPRGACRLLFGARDDEVLISGPAGTGKSRACLEKLHLMALQNPGMRGLIVRKTLTSLTSTALVTWRTYIIPEADRAGIVRYYGGSAEEPAQYRYSNGSRVMIGGLDNPTKIMSSEYDVIYVQEAIELTENDWESLTTRLRNGVISFQQLMADTNPERPFHWLNKRCGAKTTLMLESRHEDNPTLFDLLPDGTYRLTERGTAYMRRLDRLTGPRKARLRYGLWVAAEGMVYGQWDPLVHVIDRFEIPASWMRFWAIDFGYTNPFVCQWWAIDPDGRLYLYRELYRTKRLVEDHARRMMDLVADFDPAEGERLLKAKRANEGPTAVLYPFEARVWREPVPEAIICDHDAEDRATLQRYVGMVTTPAHKSIEDGVQAFASRLAAAGDGRPRMFVLRDSLVERDDELVEKNKPVCFTDEILGYVWPPDADGKPNKEKPVDEDNHSMDAGRYMVAHRDLRGRSGFRWL